MDEAANAWNAYCLLKTGMDQYGTHWPIFSLRAFGDHRTVWYAYCLLPFQAVGGMNLWTTRLPAALGGVLTLALMYLVGRRMFGRSVGLIAAALLAVNPWHIQLCRLGHEASLTPLQVLATLAMVLWSGFPLGDRERETPRFLRAVLAGAVGGVCCYGYFASRLFLPLFLGAVFLLAVLFPGRHGLRDRRRSLGLWVGALSFLLVLGPLVVKHLTDPEMNHRARWGLVWEPSDPWTVKTAKALARYPGHFGPDFLFLEGDPSIDFNPAKAGALPWYMLPLMLAGLHWCGARIRRSRSSQILLLWLVLFPVCDLILPHAYGDGVSSTRSSPGLPAFILLGAIGTVAVWHWLWEQPRRQAAVAVAVAVCGVLGVTGRFALEYYWRVPALRDVQLHQLTDVADAARYIRTRLQDVDAVVVESDGLWLPYIYFVVEMEYDPREWFAGPRVYRGDPPDALRFGKVVFHYPQDDLNRLLPPEADRLLLVLCRDHLPAGWQPVYAGCLAGGEPTTYIYEMTAEEILRLN